MVYGDRAYNEEAIANLNSNSPLTFADGLSAEDLARDLDLFTNTQFFDFDFGVHSSTTFTSLDSAGQTKGQQGEENTSHLGSLTNDSDLAHNFHFLSGIPLSGWLLKIEGNHFRSI